MSIKNFIILFSDEFIIFDSNGTVDDAIYLYKKIQERTLDFIESTNYEIYYTFSAGILDFYSHPTASYIEIMKWTEFSLNNAKESGKIHMLFLITVIIKNFKENQRLLDIYTNLLIMITKDLMCIFNL